MGSETVVPATRIAHERPEDAPAIRDVLHTAFGRPGEADLVDLLRECGHLSVSLAAWEEERLVGHVALSPMTLQPSTGLRVAGLGPIAVTPDCQGRGIGGALMHAAIGQARTRWDALFLLGDPAFYGRFGFQTAPVGNEYDAGEAFMALELTGGCLQGVEAIARYAPAFGEVGV